VWRPEKKPDKAQVTWLDISDGEDLSKEHGRTGRPNTEEADYWVKAADGKNTGDVSEADGRARERLKKNSGIN